MQFSIKRLLIVVTVCACFLGLYYSLKAVFFNRMTITNMSSEDMLSVEVTVWNQTIRVEHLGPGETAERGFRSRNFDDDFDVVVTLSNGRELRKTDGYVSSGRISVEQCVISITDKQIKIIQHKPG